MVHERSRPSPLLIVSPFDSNRDVSDAVGEACLEAVVIAATETEMAHGVGPDSCFVDDVDVECWLVSRSGSRLGPLPADIYRVAEAEFGGDMRVMPSLTAYWYMDSLPR